MSQARIVIPSEVAAARSETATKSRDLLSARTLNRCLWQVIPIALLLTTLAAAQSLSGTVKNSTTNKPSAGDDVVLLSLGQGMEESGRTKSDAKGNFTFKVDTPGPHLIRVIHQEVTYHRMAPPGTTSVEVDVYDVAKKLDGISVIADIMRFQAGQGQLQVERTFAVTNSSKPPRTQMNEHNLEFYVPDGATIQEGQAMTAGGQPVKSAPVPEGANAKNRYAFLFPLRPGETRFSVVYTVPYTGSVNIDAKAIYPLEHFVAIAPKSMQFAAAPGTNFTAAPYPGQPDANVEVASNVALGQPTAFKLSGEGTLSEPREEGAEQPTTQGAPTQTENRPGGGLGPPIDAPPPTQRYQWYILGGVALALVVGGVYIASRQQAANRSARAQGKGLLSPEDAYDIDEDEYEAAVPAGRPSTGHPKPSSGNSSSILLEVLKEELFQLEVDHTQGKITREEYLQAKSALDHTLQRALKREGQKSNQ